MGRVRWSVLNARSSRADKPGLPAQRKALVERYMIDADEAQAREELAAREEAGPDAREQEAAEKAARAATERAARERAAAEEAARAAAEREAHERQERAAAERRAAEEARRVAAEEARQAATEREAREQEAAEQAARAATERAARERRERAATERRAAEKLLPAAEGAPSAVARLDEDRVLGEEAVRTPADLPLYVWLQAAASTSGDVEDWPRALVKAREEARRVEAPPA